MVIDSDLKQITKSIIVEVLNAFSFFRSHLEQGYLHCKRNVAINDYLCNKQE